MQENRNKKNGFKPLLKQFEAEFYEIPRRDGLTTRYILGSAKDL